jgi:CTP:molybdopterin cytidylyltransferase MocA
MAVPEFNGARGHPALISRKCIGAIMDYNGDGGLGGAIKHVVKRIVSVPVSDNGILYDMDTNEDYERIKRLYDAR